MPASRTEFWEQKFRLNRARDKAAVRELAAQGWEVLIVWECQTKDPEDLSRMLAGFLGDPRPSRNGRSLSCHPNDARG